MRVHHHCTNGAAAPFGPIAVEDFVPVGRLAVPVLVGTAVPAEVKDFKRIWRVLIN